MLPVFGASALALPGTPVAPSILNAQKVSSWGGIREMFELSNAHSDTAALFCGLVNKIKRFSRFYDWTRLFFLQILYCLFHTLEPKARMEKLYLCLLVLPLFPTGVTLPNVSLRNTARAYAISLLTLTCSTIFYRLSPFHPLYQHPGPLLAKVTKFWGVYHAYTGKQHENLLHLHRKHGSIVRIG